MKITKKLIMSFNPCWDNAEEKIDALIKKYCGLRKIIKFDDIVSAYKNKDIETDDFFWLVLRPEIIPEKLLHQISIYCWEHIAKKIWEKYYPNDKRPHEVIRIKKLWLNGKASIKDLAAAREAAWQAARNDAWTVMQNAARDAARDAAQNAAWDAARCAAWDAAQNAAWDAAWCAAWCAARNKIAKYCIKITLDK